MPTHAAIGEHLDMSKQSAGAFLESAGIDHKTTGMDEIRVAYVRRLREMAAGRYSGGDLDLVTERAMLAKAQRERIEMQNDVTRGDLAPVVLIEEVLTKAAGKVAGTLDAIPGMIRRRVAGLTADDIDLITGEIAKARNIVAKMSLADLELAEDAEIGEAAIDG